MLSTRSKILLRPVRQSSVLREVGEPVWFDCASRPVTKVSAAAQVHTYVITAAARFTTHVHQWEKPKQGWWSAVEREAQA